MKRLLLLTTACLMAFTGLSQDYVRSGYVVLNSGDTVRGFVHDLEWLVNPASVNFQRTTTDAVTTYSVGDIVSFYTSRGALYQSLTVAYDASSRNLKLLEHTREPSQLKEEKVFVEVLVRSMLSLYRTADTNGRPHYYMQVDDEPLTELLSREYLTNDPASGKAKLASYPKYRQQLLNYAVSCTALRTRIQKLRYTDDALKQIVKDINACKGNEVETLFVVTLPPKKKPSFGLVFGPSAQYAESLYAVTSMSLSKPAYCYGISAEFFSRKRPQRLSFYNEIKYKQVSQDGTYFTGSRITFEYNLLSMVNALRFSVPLKDARLFWTGGIINAYRFDTQYNFALPSEARGADLETGFAVGAGATFFNNKRVKASLELRYEIHQTVFGKSDFLGSHNLGLQAGIQF